MKISAVAALVLALSSPALAQPSSADNPLTAQSPAFNPASLRPEIQNTTSLVL